MESQTDVIDACQTTSLAVACAVFTCHPHFRAPTFRKWRSVVFTVLGLSGIVSAAHGVLLYGWTVQRRRMSLDWMILMMLANCVGAGMYAARVRSLPTPVPSRPLVMMQNNFFVFLRFFFRFQRGSGLTGSTSWAGVIRSSMSWSCWLHLRILWGC